ncbi:MAG: hypothetical protein JKX81_12765 [Arenicella sp.]|nr:hypothetical protein [Arenicella sp.]
MNNVEASEERLWRKIEPLTKQQKGVCSGLMKELRNISNALGVAQGLLGTRKNIEHLFRHRSSKRLLHGWRKEHVGEALLTCLDELEV